MQILAKAYQREGNILAAESTVNDLVSYFNDQPIKKEVKDMIAKDAASILAPEKPGKQKDDTSSEN